METNLEIIEPGSLAVLTEAELNTKVDVAKRYPRSISSIKKNVLSYASCDQETAESCFYVKPVDNQGTKAEGNSIRMAEIIAAVYTNIQYGSRVIDVGEKFVTVQGVALDLENNISYSVEVKRSIWSEKGRRRYSQNMVETTIKAAAAIAVRDAIFKVVPMAIFRPEIKKIKAVATGADSDKSIAERFEAAASHFNKRHNVSFDRILQAINKKSVEEVTEQDLEILTGLKTAIKDEETTVEEAFPLTKKEELDEKSSSAVDKTEGLFPGEGK